MSPIEFASNSTNENFRTSEDLINNIRLFLATEIGVEPKIRQNLRSQFNVYAVINTRPTEEGRKIVDVFHPFREIKYLVNKPVIQILESSRLTTEFIRYIEFFSLLFIYLLTIYIIYILITIISYFRLFHFSISQFLSTYLLEY
jgi:hypothetical protein